MDIGIAQTFNNLIRQYGIIAALLAVFILVAIFLIMRYAISEIEKNREAHRSKIALAEREALARESERKAVLAELAQARQHNQAIIENHLSHDAEDRKALLAVFTEAKSKEEATILALRELAEDIKAARIEASQERKTIHERLNAIHIDIGRRA